MKVYTWSVGDRVRFRALHPKPRIVLGGESASREQAHATVSALARAKGCPLMVIIRANPGKVGRA